MPADALTYIDLSDFSPGIYGDAHAGLGYNARGSTLRPGAAVIAGTYRCCADPQGALIPLPKRVVGKTSTLLPEGNARTAPAYYPTSLDGAYLVDALVSQYTSITNAAVGTYGASAASKKFYIVYTLWNISYNTAGGGASYTNLWLGREYREHDTATPVKDYFWDSSNPNTVTDINSRLGLNLSGLGAPMIPGGSLCQYLAASTLVGATWNTFRRGLAILVQGFFNHAAIAIVAGEAAITTYDTDVAVNYPSDLGAGGFGGPGHRSLLAFHPNPAAPATFSCVRDANTVSAGFAAGAFDGVNTVGHQGRLVTLLNSDDSVVVGGGFDDVNIKGALYYTTALELGTLTDASNMIVNAENTSGYGLIASMNTDELLVVNNHGGGALIRGDMTNPTVVNLRSIESVYGVYQSAALTPIGAVYCTPNGVFVYQGGETTPKLSEQIEGDFWNYARYGPDGATLVTPNARSNQMGRSDWFHPWVCIPNNYLYDTRNKSWWRLEDPVLNTNIPYSTYNVNPTNGKLHAFPYKLTATQNVIWDEYDSSVQTSSYSWRSQPLFENHERLQSVQELVLTASIPGTVPVGDVISFPGVSGGAVTTPDSALLDVVSDIEIVCRVALADWTQAGAQQAFVSKDDTAAQRSYNLYITSAGILTLETFPLTGKVSTVAVPFIDGVAYWIKATLDVNNGAGGNDVKFWYAPDSTTEPTTWTQLGATVTTAGVTTINATTAPLWVGGRSAGAGDLPLLGRVYRAIVRAGIGGSIVADMNADTATAASTSWVSATSGETWTKQGTTLYVDAQVVGVTLTGYDADGVPVTPVTATFVLKQSSINPQGIIKQLHPNFNAMHVQCQIQATDSSYSPAPKVHSLKIGVAETRARSARS